jgi:hypothetical protein
MNELHSERNSRYPLFIPATSSIFIVGFVWLYALLPSGTTFTLPAEISKKKNYNHLSKMPSTQSSSIKPVRTILHLPPTPVPTTRVNLIFYVRSYNHLSRRSKKKIKI